MVVTSACFLAGAPGKGPVSAGESSPPAGPGQAFAATKMVLEQPGNEQDREERAEVDREVEPAEGARQQRQ